MAAPMIDSYRTKSYKNKALNPEEMRRRRGEEGVRLRKQKRDKMFFKKRNASPAVDLEFVLESADDSAQSVMQMIFSEDESVQFIGIRKVRHLLSKELSPLTDKVLLPETVNKIVQFLKTSDNSMVQVEAVSVLTDVTSGTLHHTELVIDTGAVPVLIELLRSDCEDVQEQAALALGNISGENEECRDCVLQCNVLPSLLQLLTKSRQLTTIRSATWTLSNLCRGKNPPPDFSRVSPSLCIIPQLLSSSDPDVLTCACWSVAYLSDGTNDKVQAVVDTGVCGRLVELLMHSESRVLIPALRAIGNIVTGNNVQTQTVLDHSVMPRLLTLLSCQTESIKREVCWIISNITAGSQAQIQAVIDANVFPMLMEVFKNSDFSTRKEAVWAVTNTTSGGTVEQIRYLVSLNVIKAMCDLLVLTDPKIVQVSLKGLENILQQGEKLAKQNSLAANPFCIHVEEAYGLEKIELLQNHQNQQICQKASRLMEMYFIMEEEDGCLTPPVGHGPAQFTFQQPSRPALGFRL